MGSEISHCSTMGHPASTNLFLATSGSAENLTGTAMGIWGEGLKEGFCEDFGYKALERKIKWPFS